MFSDILNESLFVKIVNKISRSIIKIIYESGTARFFNKTAEKLKSYVPSSKTAAIISHEGYFPKRWNTSLSAGILEGIFDLPNKIFKMVYKNKDNKLKESISVSLFIKAFALILNNLHTIAALMLLVVLIVPHNMWNNMYSTLGVVLLFLLFAIRGIVRDEDIISLKIFGFYLCIYVLAIITAQIFSVFPGETLRFFIFYATCFILAAFIAGSVKNTGQLYLMLKIISIGVALTGVYGIWQKISGVQVNLSEVDINANEGLPGRIFSTMDNPNNYAEILVMLLPFFAVVILNAKSVFKKAVYLCLMVPPLLSLVLTFSRSSWIGFAAAVMVFIFFKNKKLLPFLIIAGAAMVPFLPGYIINRVLSIFTGDSSTEYRMLIYKTVMPIFRDYWIFGVGLGKDIFVNTASNYYAFTKLVPLHSHNLYMQVCFETGILGLLAFFGFLGSIIKRSIQNIYSTYDRLSKDITTAGLSSLAGILTVGLAEYVWFYPRVLLIFWTVIGIMLAMNKITREKDGGVKKDIRKGGT